MHARKEVLHETNNSILLLGGIKNMANFKKGIALALVATTAFTFAPVANLGTPVVAEAAAAITSLASTSINVAKGSSSVVIINGNDFIN